MANELVRVEVEEELKIHDHTLSDPYIEAIFEEVYQYNELLATSEVTSDELRDIINALDEKWAPYMGRDAVINARMTFSDADGEPFIDKYIDHDVKSNGFVAKPIDNYLVDGNTGGFDDKRYYRICMQFIYERIRSDDYSHVLAYGSAELDDIYKLDFDGVMSGEFVKAWMYYYCPELAEDIDVALLNDAAEDGEKAIRLKGLSLDLRDNKVFQPETDIKIAKQTLYGYTDGMIKFDEQMPYVLEVAGWLWLYDEDDEVFYQARVEESTVCAAIEVIKWDNKPGDDEAILEPHLDAEILTDDKDAKNQKIRVPLSSVGNIISFRKAYFKSQEIE